MTRPVDKVVVLAAATLLWACGEPPEFEGTYEEGTPIPEGRDYAYKLDLFRFGDEVGGVVRFFPMDTFPNTRDNPFLRASACGYFGEVDLVGGSVAFRVPNGPDGETFDFLLSSLDPADINAEVSRSDGASEVRESFDMDRVDTLADDECIEPGAYALTVEFPAMSVAQASSLSLAVVYAGYRRAADQPVITRETAQITVVPTRSEDEYVTSQSLTFPVVPPSRGLSDPAEGFAQYGLAYVVLFNDGNRDGAFVHGLPSDEVLGLSPSQAVVYVSAPAGLDPSVRAVFAPDPQPFHWLYAISFAVDGEDALVTRAVPLVDGARLLLEGLGDENPAVFPALLP